MTGPRPGMENVFSAEAARRPARPKVLGRELLRLVEERDDVVVLSADMGAAVSEVRDRHPGRYFELGIAETNTVSVAAGMAACGLVPYVVSMGPFGAIKCAEQLRADVTYTRLPVRFVARLSGLAMGFFGTSHHAVEDIAIARSLTNLTVVAPCDERSTAALLRSTIDHDGPVFYRVSEGVEHEVYGEEPVIERGRFVTVRGGTDATVIATGVGVGAALGAARLLELEDISVEVLDAAYLKPLDEEEILRAAGTTGAILTVEEHSVVGGLGAAVAEVLGRYGAPARLRVHGLPDEDLDVALPAVLLERYRLTPAGVADEVRELLS
ncbi:MAG TPA: transketolase C-terminal domain-containing protein [Candidatus Dormibacteraeota bacterium]